MGNIMERRWTERTSINVPVDLSYAGEQASNCRTRDIGLGGVFVELPDQVNISSDTSVELTFKLGTPPDLTKHRINARVVRVAGDGVGMMFRDFDAIAFRSLQEVLLYNQNKPTN
jgi:c-di-GMP-binding flagellar brake protein YcgR